jgi:putative SOS response-associated peptidase YedK
MVASAPGKSVAWRILLLLPVGHALPRFSIIKQGFTDSLVSPGRRSLAGLCRPRVPASAFSEPDRNTSKPVINRWFGRTDGKPFFFAGVWREWTGDVGTIKDPDIGKHRLFGFLTTEPNGIVRPIHDKAMPVILMTADDVERWLTGTAAEALEPQRPLPDDALVVLEPEKEAA